MTNQPETQERRPLTMGRVLADFDAMFLSPINDDGSGYDSQPVKEEGE